MNVTLSADQDLIDKARRYAERHGTSLNQLFRDYLHQLTGELSRDEAAREFEAVARGMAGDSAGSGWPGRRALYGDRPRGSGRRQTS